MKIAGIPALSARTHLVEEHFHEAAPYWKDVYSQDTLNGALYRDRRASVLAFVDGLNLPENSRVLEVGCGAGSTSVALAKRGFLIEAVDVVPEMVRLTREAARASGAEDRVNARIGNVHNLDFPDASFDLVVAIGVMEWMPALAEPLGELNRVLRRGKHLITNVDNAWALHCLVDPRMGPAAAGLKRLARGAAERAGLIERVPRPSRCSRSRLDSSLRDAGFTKVEGRTGGFGPMTVFGARLLSDRTGVRLHMFLQHLANQGVPLIRQGGETYVVLARKTRPEGMR